MSIITDGEVVKQRNKIDALGIKRSVDHVFISEEFDSNGSKPSTEMFEEFLSTTGTKPENSVYIADNPAKDFVAPNTLRMRSLWVSRSWGEYTDNEPTVEREMPTDRIEDLRTVPEILEEWDKEI
jgi:putative hydrolase of the HAD superfamily